MSGIKENNVLNIGANAISAGKSAQVSISIDRLPTGTLIDIPVHIFRAKEPGPILLIQAGLHGDEINGVEIVRRMLHEKQFDIDRGTVIAVPVLNVYGFIHFSRDVPDGKDVNRSFPGSRKGSLARRMAFHYTEHIMHQVTHAVDLHTGGAQRSNYPQVRFTQEDSKSEELAIAFDAPVTFAANLIKGSFRRYAFDNGIPTVVYEAGESMRFDESAIQYGIKGIKNIMTHLGMRKGKLKAKNNTNILEKRQWLRAPTAGMFVPEVANGALVEKGQLLGTVSVPYAKKGKPIKCPFPGQIICINHQAVVNQGDALFHLGSS